MKYKVYYEDLQGKIHTFTCKMAYRVSNIIYIKINDTKEIEVNFDNVKYWERIELEEI